MAPFALIASIGAVVSTMAFAHGHPVRPVRMIAQKLFEHPGQQFIVDDRPGRRRGGRRAPQRPQATSDRRPWLL